MRIPYARPRLDASDVEAAAAVLRTTAIGQGPVVRAFETALSGFLGLPQAVAVNSGTTALRLAYRAAGVTAGSRVVLPGITFVSAATAALEEGARLIEAAVDLHTGNLDLDALEARLHAGLRPDVVCAVSYAGWPFDLPRLEALGKTFGFRIVADQSHALGCRIAVPAGTSTLFTYSFQSLKHITSGEGGAVAGADEAALARIRRLRNHGTDREAFPPGRTYRPEAFYALERGGNGRLTDFQAALLQNQLARFDAEQDRRRALTLRYLDLLNGLHALTPDPNLGDTAHALHLFTVRTNRRDALFSHLYDHGIGSQVHYVPLHRHPALTAGWDPEEKPQPSADAFFESVLSLPLYPDLSFSEVDEICTCIRRFYEDS